MNRRTSIALALFAFMVIVAIVSASGATAQEDICIGFEDAPFCRGPSIDDTKSCADAETPVFDEHGGLVTCLPFEFEPERPGEELGPSTTGTAEAVPATLAATSSLPATGREAWALAGIGLALAATGGALIGYQTGGNKE